MKRCKLFIIASLLFLCTQFTFGQTNPPIQEDSLSYHLYMKKSLVLVSGYHLHQHHFGEIGIGIMNDGIVGHHPSTTVYELSNELKFSQDFVWGLKTGAWIGGGVAGMNMGFNLINYTDFKENTLRFRPEIGMGFGIFRLVYGYNLTLTNKGFKGINTHNFGLNIMPALKTIKETKL